MTDANSVVAWRDQAVRTSLELVERWSSLPGFHDLLDEFRASTPEMALVDRMRARALADGTWLGGDQLPAGVLDDPDGEPVRDLLARVLMLEEFGDFCWNTRLGVPRALLHLLANALGFGHAGEVPVLCTDSWASVNGQRDELGRMIGEQIVLQLVNASDDEQRAMHVLDALGPSAPPGRPRDVPGDGSTFGSRLLRDVRLYPARSAQGYQERWEGFTLGYSADRTARVATAADQLGVVTATVPRGARYDHVVVLGGGGRSPLLRAEYAAELIRAGLEVGGQVWMLGSPRTIVREPPSDEVALIAEYADDAVDEFDLMWSAAHRAFAPLDRVFHVDAASRPVAYTCGCSDETASCPNWLARMRARGYEPSVLDRAHPRNQHDRSCLLPGATPGVTVLSASTGDPARRTNTADTYAYFAQVAALRPGDRVLVVTTQVFVPFQRFDAMRILGLRYGAEVEVVGFGTDRNDRPATPEYQLQEVLSAIRSARRLLVEIAR